ncbi:hypothetical protein B6U84_06550 [Candidatus Bathyarchaeota archaeon ex4484_40]|nr:MAG: hypothetical protein B6U84_06550 [Candidatus Bathyarchaeota archaeon ex4484_40]
MDEYGFLEVLERVSKRSAPGPHPSFTEAHVLMALEAISRGCVGRFRLSERLGLGPGVARTLIRHLKAEGLIEVSRIGMKLSSLGWKVLGEAESVIAGGAEVPRSPLTPDPSNFAVTVKAGSTIAEKGIERSLICEAVKAGASWVTTLIFEGGGIRMPGSGRVVEGADEALEGLVRKLKPGSGDVIIIGGGENPLAAELGAKMAAITLLRMMTQRQRSDRSPINL